MEEFKKCPHCQKIKSPDKFYSNVKFGLSSYCKECSKEIKSYKRINKIGYYATETKTIQHKNNRKKNAKNLKLIVLNHYGGAKCCKCGFCDIRALSIDHMNGDGATHRKMVPGCRLYSWLRKNKYPKGYQVLCMNCQFIKRHENAEWGNKKEPIPLPE